MGTLLESLLDMKHFLSKLTHLRTSTYYYFAIWIASLSVGLVAVLYAKGISFLQGVYFRAFGTHPLLTALCGPILFLAATAAVKKGAHEARGSGIPQVLEAIEGAKQPKEKDTLWQSRLVSLWTALIKVISSSLGILAGASIGREGPTVQIAASGYAFIGRKARKWIPTLDFSSFLIAGAAAGVAAAFNTPLAGIAFALEEIAEGVFEPFRQSILLAVIVAGVTAQALLGDYLYFGHPVLPPTTLWLLPIAALLGILGGIFGGAFAKGLTFSNRLPFLKSWWIRALVCGILCSLIVYFSHGATAGSGYEITKDTLMGQSSNELPMFFPIGKMFTTLLSYWSGMAGGIFAPCLSIGSGMGILVARLFSILNFKACALLGMASFFSGTVQAPLTAVIIVMEMTDEHTLIFPLLVAALLAQSIGKTIMPVSLYRFLVNQHREG